MLKQLVLFSLIAFSLQIQHCTTEKPICKACNTGYTLVKYDSANTKCIKNTDYENIKKIDQNCIEADTQFSSCSYCIRGYALDPSKNQCFEGAHCKTMSDGHCSDCIPPFIIDGGICKEKHFCTQMIQNICLDCEDYYYPNESGECKSIPIPNCITGNATKCTKCNKEISYLDEQDQCSDYPSHCIKSTFDHDNKKCMDCDEYYYLKDKNNCEKIPINYCKEGNDTKCTKCNETVSYLNNSICIKYADNCRHDNYDKEKNECKECNPTYYLTEQKECKEIGIPDCLKGKPGNCTQCDPNVSYLDEKICKKITPNCADFQNKECQKCNPTYYLTEQKECKEIGIPDCLEGKPGNCTQCDPNVSYLDEKICKKIPPNCADFQNKECQKCKPTYYLTEQKECEEIGIPGCLEGKPGNCTQCDANEYDKTEDGKSCIQRCIDKTGSYCYKCDDNYDSFDYGETCTVLDKDKEPQPQPQPEGNSSTNLNLAFIAFILSFII